jgi:hypothetical protein
MDKNRSFFRKNPQDFAGNSQFRAHLRGLESAHRNPKVATTVFGQSARLQRIAANSGFRRQAEARGAVGTGGMARVRRRGRRCAPDVCANALAGNPGLPRGNLRVLAVRLGLCLGTNSRRAAHCLAMQLNDKMDNSGVESNISIAM